MVIPVKKQLAIDLKKSFREVVTWIKQQPKEHFNKEMIPGKWTIAGHVYHLIKSTKAVSQGLLMSKESLASAFGQNNREERSFQEMNDKYEGMLPAANAMSGNPYEAETGRVFDQEKLLLRFEGELNDFITSLKHWNEEDMSTYVLPHPLMGKCTMREFVYFTILHTDHHLRILKERYA